MVTPRGHVRVPCWRRGMWLGFCEFPRNALGIGARPKPRPRNIWTRGGNIGVERNIIAQTNALSWIEFHDFTSPQLLPRRSFISFTLTPLIILWNYCMRYFWDWYPQIIYIENTAQTWLYEQSNLNILNCFYAELNF